MTLSISREAVDRLRAACSGKVCQPGGVGHDDVRRVHNAFLEKRPALVARRADTARVADAVRFAREQGE